MTHTILRPLAGFSALLVGAAATSILALPRPASAYSQCVQVVAYVAPNQLRCQQIGTDYLGRPVWMCC